MSEKIVPKFIIFIIAVLLAITALSCTVSAVPGIPHQFRGTVTYEGGGNVLAGTVSAEIGEQVYNTTILDGTYGYSTITEVFFVDDPNGDNAGEIIRFYVYINDEKIDTDQNAIFENGGNTSIDLTISSITNNPPNIPYNPSPEDGATDISRATDLSWTGGDPDGDPVTYDVYFEISSPPEKVSSNQSLTIYDPPGQMAYNTTYYWRIVAWDNHSARSASDEWSFTTASNRPPNKPILNSPAMDQLLDQKQVLH